VPTASTRGYIVPHFLRRKKGVTVSRHTKTWVAGIAVFVTAGLAAMGAYAYFSATGSGTASANVGSASAVTLSGSTNSWTKRSCRLVT